MTRETKIGLLVGLAFIIVIGILIADYSATSMRRPPAPMMDAMQNVLDSANNPGVRRPIGQVPAGTKTPERMIGQNLRQGTSDIHVVGPGQGDSPVRIEGAPRGRDSGPVTPADGAPVRLRGEERAVNTGEDRSTPNFKEITAVDRDTVYGWAKKYMGSPTQANIDAIYNANPSLKGNKPVRVGEKYRIPQENGNATRDAAAPPVTPTRPERPERPDRPDRVDRTELATRTDDPGSGERADRVERPESPTGDVRLVTYTTKPKDNLWKIAVQQCGDGRMVSKIRELNNLRSDEIQPGMTLKLPGKGT